MKTFQEFIAEMYVVGGRHNTALAKHYSQPNPSHFSTLGSHKNVNLRDAHDIMKDTNAGKTDDEIHSQLIHHFKS